MIVLGIDTSGYANAIGVIDGEQVLADFTFEARMDSLEKIVAHIDFALKSARLTLEDVEGIGVGLGPGSWTGIRVGVTVGKILAYSARKPVCGVPTLEVLACSARNEAPLICPVISTGAGEAVYAACYRVQGENLIRAGEYYVGDVKDMAGMITESAVLVGLRAESYRALTSQAKKFSIKAVEAMPSGAALARLAANRLERGEGDDVLSLTPLYLKESTARAFRNKYAGGARGRG